MSRLRWMAAGAAAVVLAEIVALGWLDHKIEEAARDDAYSVAVVR